MRKRFSKIYLVYCEPSQINTKNLYQCFSSLKWTSLPSLNYGRAGHTMGLVNGKTMNMKTDSGFLSHKLVQPFRPQNAYF